MCGNTPNPAGSNLNYGYQGFDNFAMMSLVVFQVGNACLLAAIVCSAYAPRVLSLLRAMRCADTRSPNGIDLPNGSAQLP